MKNQINAIKINAKKYMKINFLNYLKLFMEIFTSELLDLSNILGFMTTGSLKILVFLNFFIKYNI